MILAKRLDRGVQMIAHDRAVQPAAHIHALLPVLNSLRAYSSSLSSLTSMSIRSLSTTCVAPLGEWPWGESVDLYSSPLGPCQLFTSTTGELAAKNRCLNFYFARFLARRRARTAAPAASTLPAAPTSPASPASPVPRPPRQPLLPRPPRPAPRGRTFDREMRHKTSLKLN